MGLYQLHEQINEPPYSSVMVEQANITSNQDFKDWISRVKAEHKLPPKCQWMVCNDKSPAFVMAVGE